jgi:hypothetical protein
LHDGRITPSGKITEFFDALNWEGSDGVASRAQQAPAAFGRAFSELVPSGRTSPDDWFGG